MNYEERADMRQLEIRIERLERELNELKAQLARKRSEKGTDKAVEKAIVDVTKGAEVR